MRPNRLPQPGHPSSNPQCQPPETDASVVSSAEDRSQGNAWMREEHRDIWRSRSISTRREHALSFLFTKPYHEALQKAYGPTGTKYRLGHAPLLPPTPLEACRQRDGISRSLGKFLRTRFMRSGFHRRGHQDHLDRSDLGGVAAGSPNRCSRAGTCLSCVMHVRSENHKNGNEHADSRHNSGLKSV